MNEIVKKDSVFRLGDIADYKDGEIVHVDITQNDKMRMAVKAFDAGCELPAHTAPGNVIVFALEGEAIIRNGEKDHAIKAGENFFFAKDELHAVKATSRFKMAVVVDLA